MKFRDDDSNLDVFVALVAGVGIGFGLGILFAPNAGTKTRKLIAKSASDAVDQLKDTVEDIRSSAADLVESQRDVLAQAVEGTKKLYREATR